MTDSLLEEINTIQEEIAAAIGAPGAKELLTMSATNIFKANAITAAQTSGAHAVSRKLIDTTIAVARDKYGLSHEILDTPLGRGALAILISFGGMALVMNPSAAAMLPPGMSERLAKVLACANQGALNEAADGLLQAALPFLEAYSDISVDVDVSELAEKPAKSVG